MNKLDEIDKQSRKIHEQTVPDKLMLWDKINEIIDWINQREKVPNPLVINHAVQNDLDRLEILIKETKKTWIVIRWEYIFEGIGKDLKETPKYKRATKLLCIETGEIKEIK